MTHQQIISDLKSRGESNISFWEDGTIVSRHGRNTVNYWIVLRGELHCYDCKTIY